MIKTLIIPLIITTLLTGVIMGGCAQQATPAPIAVAPEEPLVVSGAQGIDLSGYGRIALDASHIEVSSVYKDWGKEHLLKESGFWHVPVPKETDEAWVIIDLESERKLDALAIKPRTDLLKQLWEGNAAVLEGSNDKQTWTPEVTLEIKHEGLNEQDWIAFVLPEDMASYRYYRLFINSPDFISMAGLQLYGEGGITVTELTSSQSLTSTYPDLPVVSGAQGTDLSGYGRIALDANHIEVSSTYKDWGKENLLKESGFWHVPVPKETSEAWVIIDLQSERGLDVLCIKPRTDNLSQLWQGDTAILEGSNDQQEWIAEVRLELNHEELNDQDWIAFILPDDMDSYRYYRLFITDPGFISMAGLNVYGEGGVVAPPPHQIPAGPLVVSGKQGITLSGYGKITLDANHIEVSSTYKDWGKENLLKESGFWHVPVPKETNEAWVIIDLESERQVDALAIKPRADLVSHLWKGNNAVLEGSNDKTGWTALVGLELNHEQLNDTDWIAFILPDDMDSYRYYRLFITDPGFISMAGLNVYGEGGIVTPPPHQIPAGLPVVSGEQGIDLPSYGRIELNPSLIEVSSAIGTHGGTNLIKRPGFWYSFWHVKVPKETDEAWVIIDLQSERGLDALCIQPRRGFPSQLWQGDAAIFEGSNDKQEWTAEVKLELNHEELSDWGWITFVLPKDIGAFRYYRLFITDPRFYSIGGLRVYE